MAMARNGVLSRRWRSEKMDGLDLFPSEDGVVHVLAVDDSLVDRKVIERLLRISSCKVTAVDSGRRALQFLGLNEDCSTSVGFNELSLKVDLIITDYCMPGMSGYELLKKIKESSTFREIPVVIMSSENVVARIHRCLEEGAEDFIVKPVKLSDVKRIRDYTTAKEVRGSNGENGGENLNKKRNLQLRESCSDLSQSPSSVSSPSSPPSISSSVSLSSFSSPSHSPSPSPTQMSAPFSPSTLSSPTRRLEMSSSD